MLPKTTDRKTNGRLFHSGLLSYTRPFKPVTASILARWVKSLLQLAGIDTEISSAHFMRGVLTLAALSQGVSVSDILYMADWSQENT